MFWVILFCITKANFHLPTSAFIGSLIIISVGGTLRQTLSIVTDSFDITTHSAIIKVRSVTQGTVSMAAHTLLLLFTGKVVIGTIIHTLILMEEVVLVTLWEKEKKERNAGKE